MRTERASGDDYKDVTYTPKDPGWAYAKFCFRSSLFSFVTLVDHLYGVHLVVANNVVTASAEIKLFRE